MSQRLKATIIILLLSSAPLHAKQSETEFLLLVTGTSLAVTLVFILLLLLRIRQRNQKLDQYRKQEQHLLNNSPAMAAMLDKQWCVMHSNKAWQRFFAGSLSAKAPLALFADANAVIDLVPTIKHQLQQQGGWQGEVWLQNTLGTEPFQLQLLNLHEPEQQPLYYLSALNIADYKAQSQQLRQSSFRDPETQLASRSLFEEQLSYSLQSCTQHYPQLAVIMLKIVPLAAQSDAAAAMHNLHQVIQQLSTLLPPEILLARFDTDTLVMLLPPHLCQDHTYLYLNQLAHKIIHYDLTGTATKPHPYKLAIGISLSPNDGRTVSDLLANVAKTAERALVQPVSAFYFSDSAELQQVPDLYALEQKLHLGAAQGEFTLFYLPKFSISSNRIIGFEALLRWPSPERGMLTPSHFLPLIEASGLICKLDRITFRKACQQVVFWQQTALMRGRLAINISELHFTQPDFIQFLQETLTEFELKAELFCLELPETLFKEPALLLKEKLQVLEKLGFRLILDNFGEGVSSLTLLQHYPLHGVKLAASVVKQIEHNEQQRNVCASMIRLLTYLQLEVIATNIETEMQAYLLHVMGCDSQQGYRFSRAIPAEDVGPLLLRENQLLGQQRQMTS